MLPMSEEQSSSQSLTPDDVVHVAKLALLELTPDEIDRFTIQLGAVLDTAADLAALDLADIEPTRHPFGLTNVMRPDTVVDSLDRDVVQAQAPDVEDGRFKVPPAQGDD